MSMGTPIDTFRRTMRRLEKRARRMRLTHLAYTIRALAAGTARRPTGRTSTRAESWAASSRGLAAERQGVERDLLRRNAFVLERAADAVARLRAGIDAVERSWGDGGLGQ